MKKIYIFLISFVAGACLAIGGYMLVDYLIQGNNKPQPVPNELQEELQDEPQDDHQELPPYKSSDLQMAMARGNVKKLVTRYAEGYKETFNYTRSGINEQYQEDGSAYIERNELGQIIAWSDGSSEYEWRYNHNGFLDTYVWMEGLGTYGNTRYEYNDENELIKVTAESQSQGFKYTIISTMSDYQYDSHGNWISRRCKVVSKEFDCSDVMITADTKTDTETRTITYYE